MMNRSLDCGCYLPDDGPRVWCPSCSSGSPIGKAREEAKRLRIELADAQAARLEACAQYYDAIIEERDDAIAQRDEALAIVRRFVRNWGHPHDVRLPINALNAALDRARALLARIEFLAFVQHADGR